MQEFTNWTVSTIREDRLITSWMEERKFDWIPLVSKTITNIIEQGKTVLIITDDQRAWFLSYILSKINDDTSKRPLLPFLDFSCVTKNFAGISSDSDVELMNDMLDLTFPNGYVFWYIGKSHSKKAILPKVTSNSFLWLFDEDVPNSFVLKSTDETLDMKLLQLYRLFNKTLDAALFAEIEVDK